MISGYHTSTPYGIKNLIRNHRRVSAHLTVHRLGPAREYTDEPYAASSRRITCEVAFNYKTTTTAEVLEKEGPINIYRDNVGGETLETAIHYAAKGARFIKCGMISGYNTSMPYAIKNLMQIVTKSLHIHGFIVSDLRAKYTDEFYSTFPGRVARGEIKHKEYILRGLERSGEGILDVLKGKNFGKCAIVVADE